LAIHELVSVLSHQRQAESLTSLWWLSHVMDWSCNWPMEG